MTSALGSTALAPTAGSSRRRLSMTALADVLARHIHDRVRDRSPASPDSTPDRRGVQVRSANRLLHALLAEPAASPPGSEVDVEAQLLLEVGSPCRASTWRPMARPGIPLRDSALLVNGHKDLQIGTQVALEIQSADRVDLLCAFVRFAGLRLIRPELQEFLLRGGAHASHRKRVHGLDREAGAWTSSSVWARRSRSRTRRPRRACTRRRGCSSGTPATTPLTSGPRT